MCRRIDHRRRDIKEENIQCTTRMEIRSNSSTLGLPSPLEPSLQLCQRNRHLRYLNSQYRPKPAAVWAIGCLAFCYLSSFTYQVISIGPDWSLIAHCSTDSIDFVKCCLNISERKRMPFSMMRHHIWIVDSIENFSNF